MNKIKALITYDFLLIYINAENFFNKVLEVF